MMKTLWIHAGMPKCGSSALQVFLAKHRQRLLRHGIDYLPLTDLRLARQGSITSGNAGFLARSLLTERDEGAVRDDGLAYRQFLDALGKSKVETSLVSSEFFAFVDAEAYARLLADLQAQGWRARCIYYVRRQDQVLISGYMQKVKRHGYLGAPEDFVRDAYRHYDLLNYHDSALQFERTFGVGQLSVGIYEATERHPKGIAGDFLEKLLGHCPEWVEPQAPVNLSPSPLELRLMLAANQYRPRMRFSDILSNNSALSGQVKPYVAHNILAPALIEEVLNHFAEQNRRLAEHYTHGEAFPLYQEAEYLDLKRLRVEADDLMVILAGFLVNFDRRLAQLEQGMK